MGFPLDVWCVGYRRSRDEDEQELHNPTIVSVLRNLVSVFGSAPKRVIRVSDVAPGRHVSWLTPQHPSPSLSIVSLSLSLSFLVESSRLVNSFGEEWTLGGTQSFLSLSWGRRAKAVQGHEVSSCLVHLSSRESILSLSPGGKHDLVMLTWEKRKRQRPPKCCGPTSWRYKP